MASNNRVFTSSTKENEVNGAKVLNLTLKPEQAEDLIALCTEVLNGLQKDETVQMSMWTENKQTRDGSREFVSTSIQLSAKAPYVGKNNGGGSNFKRSFQPKAQQQQAATQARSQRVRQAIED